MALSYNYQPPNQRKILPDEENDMTYYDQRRESFDLDINQIKDLMSQPPWHGSNPITSIVIEGEIIEDYEYDVVDGHRDPASVYGTYSYEDVVIELWQDDLLVLRHEIGDLSESDMTWGRLVGDAEVEAAGPATQPFLQWMLDNRELAGYLPEEIR